MHLGGLFIRPPNCIDGETETQGGGKGQPKVTRPAEQTPASPYSSSSVHADPTHRDLLGVGTGQIYKTDRQAGGQMDPGQRLTCSVTNCGLRPVVVNFMPGAHKQVICLSAGQA